MYSTRAALLGALLIAVTPPASADAWHEGLVKMVYPLGDGSFALGFEAPIPGCSSSGLIRYVHVVPSQNGVTVDGAKSMLGTVLTAFAMGTTVAVAFNDTTNYCYVNRLYIKP